MKSEVASLPLIYRNSRPETFQTFFKPRSQMNGAALRASAKIMRKSTETNAVIEKSIVYFHTHSH